MYTTVAFMMGMVREPLLRAFLRFCYYDDGNEKGLLGDTSYVSLP